MAQRLAGAHVAVLNKLPVDGALLDACPDLQLVCVAATGYDVVDVAACAERDVTVCNARGYATPSVVQHVWSLILALTTHLPSYRAAVQNGSWSGQPQFALIQPPVAELAGKTLGIVGYGTLGRAVADVAPAFGMHVVTLQRGPTASRPTDLPLPALLDRSDVLTLHCPLTAETRRLIDADALSRLGSSGILVNTARGGIRR